MSMLTCSQPPMIQPFSETRLIENLGLVPPQTQPEKSHAQTGEIVATLPQGTQVVVEAKLLTSDVDHTIEEVRQEVQQQQNGLNGSAGGVSRGSNRTLFCRKCEGHGAQVVLKGHASRCPYNNCQCKTCSNVMSMRANAIIRRYRTRTLEGGLVLKPVHFKNGNTRLRVFPKYVDESDALPIPMSQQLSQAYREKHPQNPDLLLIEPVRPLQDSSETPPDTAVPSSANSEQPAFIVKRSFSEQELDLNRQSGSPKQNSLEQSPPAFEITQNAIPLSILEFVLRQNSQGLNTTDLFNNGLLPGAINTTTVPSCFDSGLLNGLSFPNSAIYSSPSTTYASSYLPTSSSSTFPASIDVDSDRKVSDILRNSVGALSELNIGVTTSSPIHAMADVAPKLTPNMFESSFHQAGPSEEPSEESTREKPEPEAFTSTLMIAPTADRKHPLFRKFLNTVRELEKQMLFDMDS